MWKQLLRSLASGGQVEPLPPDRGGGFYVYRVSLPEGFKDVVSLVPHDSAFESGIAGEAIVGVCTELLEKGELVTVSNFRPNKRFLDLLHSVIAKHAPNSKALQAEARRQGTGWVYLIDARTPTPAGEVPPHDVIGAFEVRDGEIVLESYQANANHRIFSSDGLFRLEPTLHEQLMVRVTKANTTSQDGTGYQVAAPARRSRKAERRRVSAIVGLIFACRRDHRRIERSVPS